MLKFILFIGTLLCTDVYGNLSLIVDPCCEKGTEWAQSEDRCDNYPTAVSGVEDKDQPICRSVLEVCCLKSKQEQMCATGKTDAEDSGQCAVRDDQLGAATYKECCHCCRMGLAARSTGMECEAPPIGNPCDLKFMECCTGITGTNPDTGSNDTDVADINECQVFGETELCSQRCINTVGSYRCACNQGYALAQDERTCYRISQVETCQDRNPCSQTCVDTAQGPVCTCRQGYLLLRDRRTCRDVNECRRRMDDCRDDEVCINTPGSFRCVSRSPNTCQTGYIYDPVQQTCIPEHLINRRCRRGFAFNTVTQRCEDIDECVIQTHDCTGENQICENRRGTFYCRCEDGFMPENRQSNNCVDIDECARQMDNCTATQRCENMRGSFACRRNTGCGTGYTLNEDSQLCVDQDECESGTHNCGTGYECYNTEGSFRCNPRTCPSGTRFSASTGQCEAVSCPVGFKPGAVARCEDINECAEGQYPCRVYETCINSYGSYRCESSITCDPGLEVDPNTEQCVDIDECTTNQHNCFPGQTCVNQHGSFICTCPDGYRSRGNGPCRDIDECLYRSMCPYNSKCENTEGSFRCVCNDGLRKEGRQCVDIDECENQNPCQQKCVNIVGSYQCSCNSGYQLRQDGFSCEDVDECQQYGVCGGECINLPGSYRCTCPEGWMLLGNGRSCKDVNECETGLDVCGTNPDTMCFNTRGSHKCPTIVCPSGFHRAALGPHRNSVRCKRLSFTCQMGDQACLDAPLSLSYNFLTFPTNVKIPTDLFAMAAPITVKKIYQWSLDIVSVIPLSADTVPVTEDHFELVVNNAGNNARLILNQPIEGAQDIELIMKMEIIDRETSYVGAAVSHIFLYVTPRSIR